MHPPYLALTWPPEHAESCEALPHLAGTLRAAGWTVAALRPGLALWQRPERPLAIEVGRDLVMVGRWFGEPALLRDEGDGDLDAAERARRLCGRGWGSYLALIRGEGGWLGFRDPSGAVEALTWAAGPYGVLASSLADLPPGLLPHRLALDWTVIAEQLRQPVAQMARSALRGVSPIAPGDLQPIGGDVGTATAIWRPQDFAPTRADVDPSWPDRLAATVETVVSRLLGPYERIVCEASGGLDSSVMKAAALRTGAGDRLAAALHYVGDRPEADERAWVRRLCEPHSLAVAFVPLATGPIDPETDFAALARDARPPYAAIDPDRDRDTVRVLADYGAQALVTGKGGDAAFFQMPSAAVLADLWHAHGLAAVRHPRHAEVARWTRRSVWSLWREAWRGPPTKPAFGVMGRLAGPCLDPTAPPPPHRWLERLDGLPPGKRLQVEALASSQLAIGAHRRGAVADVVQPLLSQPVMELCLSIPSWELVRGGRDRGLAREAFAGWLPEEILHRRAKGNLTSHYARRTAASASALRAHLLDGVLVDAGILDRRETEAALRPDSLIWRSDGIDLIGVAAVESWVRYWQTRAPDVPEASRPRLGA